MKSMLTCLLFLTGLSLSAQNKEEAAIRAILNEQIVFWNKGNLDEFMKGYWNNDSLLFIGSKGPTYGYKKTLDNYHKTYPGTDAMGTLSFDLLKIQPISAEAYFVAGKWMLTRKAGNAQGYYTLLFRKIKGEWKIVVDHSS
ncbi:MAG: hypothetical protein RLZZ28_1555 [Bacteroidota bacterium]|jgi:ketosteroid isomerase-like protein